MGIESGSASTTDNGIYNEEASEATQNPTQSPHVSCETLPNDRYQCFCVLLKEWGFNPIQLMLISDAMTEAGLELVNRNDAVYSSQGNIF